MAYRRPVARLECEIDSRVRVLKNIAPENISRFIIGARHGSREIPRDVTRKRGNWRLSDSVAPACLLHYADQSSRRLVAPLTIMLIGRRRAAITVCPDLIRTNEQFTGKINCITSEYLSHCTHLQIPIACELCLRKSCEKSFF